MITDLLLASLVWLMLLLWQFSAFPFLFNFFQKRLADAGWAFGRLFSWLVLSIVIWFLAHFKIGVNSQFGIWVGFLSLTFASFKLFEKNKKQLKKFWKEKKTLIILEEILFLFGFIFLLFFRSYNPDILDLEKFMDAGFIVSYSKSATLPLEDMWLAGEKVNYYTFGHFMGSVALNFWDVEIAKGYNLLLALMMGLVLSQTASIAINFTSKLLPKKKYRHLVIFAGILASFLVGFASNTHFSWYFLKNQTLEGFWYPDSTRFIERTIHEFPAYSFIVSDLHAHVWSFPIVLFLIVNIFAWLQAVQQDRKKIADFFKREFVLRSILIGIIFGVIVGTSAWDVAIYGLLLSVLGMILLLIDFSRLPFLVISALLIFLSMLVTSSPWWLNFVSISEGIEMAYEHSPLWQLLVLWLGHFSISLLALILWRSLFVGLKRKQRLQHSTHLLILMAMTTTAWLLIVIPELVFVKDIYPSHPRANTMFKLTFQGFALMSISAACFMAYLSQFRIIVFNLFNRKNLWRRKKLKLIEIKKQNLILLPIKIFVSVFIIIVGVYPYFGYRDYYGGLKTYKGLDGLLWLKERHSTDYQAIIWLNKYLIGRPVIVEAVGESYTTFARISTFTGYPTIVGWRVHEWLWRGGFDIPGKRTEEVKKIYEYPLSADCKRILNQYRVNYIFVGDKEREAYNNINEIGLKELGQVVFQDGNTYIIKVL